MLIFKLKAWAFLYNFSSDYFFFFRLLLTLFVHIYSKFLTLLFSESLLLFSSTLSSFLYQCISLLYLPDSYLVYRSYLSCCLPLITSPFLTFFFCIRFSYLISFSPPSFSCFLSTDLTLLSIILSPYTSFPLHKTVWQLHLLLLFHLYHSPSYCYSSFFLLACAPYSLTFALSTGFRGQPGQSAEAAKGKHTGNRQ